MRPLRLLLASTLMLLGGVEASAQDRHAVEAELERLRVQLRIPGLSAAVAESGTTVWVRHMGFKAASGEAVRYPLASLTQPFAAVLAMQLADAGRLRLDAIRPLLTHTGPDGADARFVYSTELFRTMQPALERAAGRAFPAALTAQVLKAAGLRHTIAPPRATPSGGLESTVEDLARFAIALERGPLLTPRARADMFRPPRGPAGVPRPHALGWFVQHVGGEEVRWQFGEDPEASSLVVMLPRRRLTFVVLARTDRLNAPFWLQAGDVRWSPFAAAFLTGWARLRLDLGEARRVMMQALIALHASRTAEARAHAAKAIALAPALGDAPDGALLAAFARSGDAELRTVGRRIAKRLLGTDAEHPRTLLDLAVLALEDGQPAEAGRLLRQVASSKSAPPELVRAAAGLLKKVDAP